MFEDVLTPSDPAYIAQYREFQARFGGAVAKASYWKRSYKPNGEFDDQTQISRQLRAPKIALPKTSGSTLSMTQEASSFSTWPMHVA